MTIGAPGAGAPCAIGPRWQTSRNAATAAASANVSWQTDSRDDCPIEAFWTLSIESACGLASAFPKITAAARRIINRISLRNSRLVAHPRCFLCITLPLALSRRLTVQLIGLALGPFRGYIWAGGVVPDNASTRSSARARDDDAARELQCQARIRGTYSSTRRCLVHTHTFAQICLQSDPCSGNKIARWPGPRPARAIRRR
jgi:hypothetical protein